MKLKELESGMVVHCKTEEEAKQFINWAHECGYRWNSGKSQEVTYWEEHMNNTCYELWNNKRIAYWDEKYLKTQEKKIIEFSDLIMPELTAEEVLEWLYENYENSVLYKEVFGENYLFQGLIREIGAAEVVRRIVQCKAEHEKKAPEIETVDICRIIEILPGGRKQCVHEEDIKPDPELPYGSERLEVEKILKSYCAEHEGQYIAEHEVISRVKAV